MPEPLLSYAQFRELVDVITGESISRQAIRDAALNGWLKDSRRGNKLEVLSAVRALEGRKVMMKRGNPASQNDEEDFPNTEVSARKKAYYDALRAKRDHDEVCGNLLEKKQVVRMLASAIKIIKGNLANLVKRIPPKVTGLDEDGVRALVQTEQSMIFRAVIAALRDLRDTDDEGDE